MNSLIVTVLVTKSTRVVQQASFSVPAIFGPSDRWSDAYRIYTSTKAMISDGFLTSDPEYIEAQALMSQAIKPAQFIVTKFSAAVTQEDTFAVNTLTVGHVYQFTIDSVPITYTALNTDTQQSILAALGAAIAAAFPAGSPVTVSVSGSGAGASLVLMAAAPGAGFSISAVDSQLTHVAVTANHSIVQDIVTAQDVIPVAEMFYGVIVTSHVASDILQIATYIETQLLVYITASSDAGCLTSGDTDIMSLLKAEEFDRTLILYSAQANTNGPDGAWCGYMLPTTPGSSNWADKTLVGVSPDNLTPTQIANVVSKNGNVYVTVAGNGCTLYGIAPGGEYIDVTIFLDWLSSQIQTNIIALITDPGNLKIPYTNPGIAMVENQISAAMKQGEQNGGLAPGWTVFAPDVSAVSPADKSNRTLNNIGASGELAGAINKVNVNVYVSV